MFGIRYEYMYAEFKLNQRLVLTPEETKMVGIHYIGGKIQILIDKVAEFQNCMLFSTAHTLQFNNAYPPN